MKKHKPGKSKIGKAISEAVAQLGENDPDADPCVVGQGGCYLSGGIEHLFVSLAAKSFVDNAHVNKRKYPFEQLIYAPHTSVERKCGFDLSVGLYNMQARLRLMHKIIYARKASDPWCDQNWSWKSLDIKAEKDLTNEHFGTIVTAHVKRPHLEPFLVIHVCYCLHEYRRMGQKIGGEFIPDFADKARTVVVELSKVQEADHFKNRLKAKKYGIEVSHDAATSTYTARLVRHDKPISLPVHPFSELLKRFLVFTPTTD